MTQGFNIWWKNRLAKGNCLSVEDVWTESTELEALKQEEKEQAQASGLDCNAPMPLDIVSDVSHLLLPNCCQVAPKCCHPKWLTTDPALTKTKLLLQLHKSALQPIMSGNCVDWSCQDLWVGLVRTQLATPADCRHPRTTSSFPNV